MPSKVGPVLRRIIKKMASSFGFLAVGLLSMQEWLDPGALPAMLARFVGGVAAPDGLLAARAGP